MKKKRKLHPHAFILHPSAFILQAAAAPEVDAPDAGLHLLIPLLRRERGEEADLFQLRDRRGQPPLEDGDVVRLRQADVAADAAPGSLAGQATAGTAVLTLAVE